MTLSRDAHANEEVFGLAVGRALYAFHLNYRTLGQGHPTICLDPWGTGAFRLCGYCRDSRRFLRLDLCPLL